jgi:hypothetical protein
MLKMRFDSCCGESVGEYGAVRVAMSGIWKKTSQPPLNWNAYLRPGWWRRVEGKAEFLSWNPTYADLSHQPVAGLGRRTGSGYVGKELYPILSQMFA